MSSCYVIASWGGPRRKAGNIASDGAFYVREHVNRVRWFRENVDHIVVASPACPNPIPGYEEYLKQLELEGKVEVFRRPNIGLSYGAYNDVYGKYRTKYDFYFVAEDDYLPAMYGFDRILLDIMDEHPKCGFLCGLIWPNPGKPFHAGIFHGVMRSEALEKVWLAQKCLAKLTSYNYQEAEVLGQIGMSWSIAYAGYEILDWTPYYSSPFWDNIGLRVYGNPALPPLYVPGQTLNVSGSRVRWSLSPPG